MYQLRPKNERMNDRPIILNSGRIVLDSLAVGWEIQDWWRQQRQHYLSNNAFGQIYPTHNMSDCLCIIYHIFCLVRPDTWSNLQTSSRYIPILELNQRNKTICERTKLNNAYQEILATEDRARVVPINVQCTMYMSVTVGLSDDQQVAH